MVTNTMRWVLRGDGMLVHVPLKRIAPRHVKKESVAQSLALLQEIEDPSALAPCRGVLDNPTPPPIGQPFQEAMIWGRERAASRNARADHTRFRCPPRNQAGTYISTYHPSLIPISPRDPAAPGVALCCCKASLSSRQHCIWCRPFSRLGRTCTDITLVDMLMWKKGERLPPRILLTKKSGFRALEFVTQCGRQRENVCIT